MSITKALNILDDTLNFVRSYDFSSQSRTLNTECKYDSDLEWPATRVRQQFIDYFVEKQNHVFKPSSPVVPIDDPTLLFTNAGMNQFKPIFLGNITDDDPLFALKRACNSQKCIRAGGKHNDLDDVGKDTYHHTFFEMLGNWSFGDYFKEEAISMAWDLLVNVYGLDKTRIFATYFGGDKSQGLESDEEAKAIWLRYLPESRVLPFGMKDNFWEMGETGPCGPCTEIHYDRLSGRGDTAAALVNMDDATVIEIWNLVFIQYNRNEDSSLQLLPNKHVDTGMGFERITSILQNVDSNYDTDIFMPIIREIQAKCNCPHAYTGKVGAEDVSGLDMAYRVVADHIRTLTFAITDGAQPDKQGRNYVIRRICRRGVRYGKKLGGEIGFFKQLVDIVVQQMSDFFPEIAKRKAIVSSIIEEEENLFSRTLENGEKRFLYEVNQLKAANKGEINGDIAFKLYSTFGFPLDLTSLMAEEHGMSVNRDEYEERMEQERVDSNAKSGATSSFAALGDNERVHLMNNGVKETDDSFKYEWSDISVDIVAIFDSNSRSFVDSVSSDHDGLVALVLNRTAFYAESGGQVGDIGYIEDAKKENAFKVNNVEEFGSFVIHIGECTNGGVSVGAKYETHVDYEHRGAIAPNHTMTHVLNHALRAVLGTECNQKGSLVDAYKLRFDYSTNRSLKIKDIAAVSKECNQIISDGLDVFTAVIEYKEATKINALRAMFGERYPQNVRVVSIGIAPQDALRQADNESNFSYSIELCGGTHLKNTSSAKHFVFLSDDALSAGIRRVVCLTGFAAKRAIEDANELRGEFDCALALEGGRELSSACALLSFRVDNAKIDAVVKHELRKKLGEIKSRDRAWQKQQSKARKEKVIDVVNKIVATKFIVKRIDVGLDKKALKEGITAFYKKKKNADVAIMLISCDPHQKNKIIVLAQVPNKAIHCGKWVQSILQFIEGPVQWKANKMETKAEVQGKSMANVAKVIQVADQYMKDKVIDIKVVAMHAITI
eukprot:535128_1